VSKAFLEGLVQRAQTRFTAERSLLSFSEYLDEVKADPAPQLRDSARYLRDALLFYGKEILERPYGRFTRYRLFDCPFDRGRNALAGQESVQQALFELLEGFVQAGRVDRLILLHGPNGSAKSSFISCLFRGLEDYSHQAEGALFSFNWVFPSVRLERGNIGFAKSRGLAQLESYAHLAEGDIDARLRVETRDHPLLLLPKEERLRFIHHCVGPDVQLPKVISEGELNPKSREIFEALLRAYRGDLEEVFKHVQVERFYISSRYRQAAVTVDPQMRVDATVRQLTADRSLSALPPSLQNLTLFEPMGDLVAANRGLIEYNDLLKRPVEAFKYLLSTCEHGEVRLETTNLFLDMVFIGSCNARLLAAFKEMPDFASFKARIELIPVPYLLDYQQEKQIYREQLEAAALPLSPLVAEVAALWAVLTRLERPRSERHPRALRPMLGRLTPLQKALLYAEGRVPEGLGRDLQVRLKAMIPTLYKERKNQADYEGSLGASPRELKNLLLLATRHSHKGCLSPMRVLQEIDQLCKQSSLYEFLRQKPDGEYHRLESLRRSLEEWYLDLLEESLNRAMGLVNEEATEALLARYVEHVTFFVKKEKRLNPMTGAYEPPDEALMKGVELRLKVENPGKHRPGIIHRIAAWRMDNPKAPLEYPQIFSQQLSLLESSYYEEKRAEANILKRDLLRFLVEGAQQLPSARRAQIESILERLETEQGLQRACAVEVIGFLLKKRPEGP